MASLELVLFGGFQARAAGHVIDVPGRKPHARHEHHGRPTAPSGDEGIVVADMCPASCRTAAQDGWNPHQEHLQTSNRGK
jgi:hypothetical protein